MQETDDLTVSREDRALRQGYQLHWYRIDRVLGRGGFGITYLAHDHNLDRPVAIKEYLPSMFADRGTHCSVVPLSPAHEENYRWGLDSFLKEARTLAKFDHPNIVRVHSVFEHNSTAYMVMEYEDGESLQSVYEQRQGPVTETFLRNTFFPIFEGLEQIHKLDFIHRDIKPPNIYLRSNRVPVLLDFGSAREASIQKNSELTAVITRFYAPLEQYSSGHGTQGDWTDIYALAASMYDGITGSRPADAQDRFVALKRTGADSLKPLDARTYPQFSEQFLYAVMVGLALEKDDRPQSIPLWREFFDKPEQGPHTDHVHTAVTVPAARRRWRSIAGGGAVVILLAILGPGAWQEYGPSSSVPCAEHITLDCLAELPVPVTAVSFLPADQQLTEQLDDLEKLAELYRQLANISSIRPEVNAWTASSLNELVAIADTWNSQRYPQVAERLRRVASILPATEAQQARLDERIRENTAANELTREAALEMIAANRIVAPAGESLIDRINAMSEAEYRALIQTNAWQSMIARLSTSALNRIHASQFDEAAQLVEVAMLMDPQHSELQQLRAHLAADTVLPR